MLYGCSSLDELFLGEGFSLNHNESGFPSDQDHIWFEPDLQQYYVLNEIPKLTAGHYKLLPEGTVIVRFLEQPADQYVHDRDKLKACVNVSGKDLKYQWQFQQAGKVLWQNFGSDSDGVLLSKRSRESWDGWHIRCCVTADYGILYSEEAVIHIVPASRIIVQPEDQVVTDGAIAAYQWQFKTCESAKWQNFGTESNDHILTKRARVSWNGWFIRCMAVDICGTKVYSGEARITIAPKPSVIVQPVAQEVAVSQKLNAFVEASGTELRYQWQFKQISGTKWQDFSSESDTPSLAKRTRIKWDGWMIRCRIADKFNNVIYTDEVPLHIYQK